MNSTHLDPVREHLAARIIGQQKLIDSMLMGLLSEGHLLVEGMPGLAKTTAVKALAEAIEAMRAMRLQEGQALQADLEARLDAIEETQNYS